MNSNKKSARTLKKVASWLNGRGRKYVNDSLNLDEVNEAIGESLFSFNTRMNDVDFLLLTAMAVKGMNHNSVEQMNAVASAKCICRRLRIAMRKEKSDGR